MSDKECHRKECSDQVVAAYYQGIEDLAHQVLSYIRNVDILQSWELRDLMYDNLNSFQQRPAKIDFTA